MRRWAAVLVLGLILPGPAAAACEGDGSGSSGGDYRGRNGDQEAGRDSCHSFCGNTIIIPGLPGTSPQK